LSAAADLHGETTIVLVDNGSTDGSLEIQQRYLGRCRLVATTVNRVGAVRNFGARTYPSADLFAFIDCDCVIGRTFFVDAQEIVEATGADAVGCEVVSPADGHWSEQTWDRLHRPGGDGPRHYINSACFCITAARFWKLGGFDEQKVSSEDVDICRRLANGGGTMWQSERLAVVHLGNPKSILGLYRRVRWHGEGIWERGKGLQWSVSTAAALAHPVAVVSGLLVGFVLSPEHPMLALLCTLVGLLLVPSGFVAARAIQFRRSVPWLSSIVLMSISLPARLHGLLRSVLRNAHG
jgi:hypothetical protein